MNRTDVLRVLAAANALDPRLAVTADRVAAWTIALRADLTVDDAVRAVHRYYAGSQARPVMPSDLNAITARPITGGRRRGDRGPGFDAVGAARFLAEVNAGRADAGLPPLDVDATTCRTAADVLRRAVSQDPTPEGPAS